MKALRIIALAGAGLGIALISSCGCCTSKSPVPPLRQAPNFQDFGGVNYSGK